MGLRGPKAKGQADWMVPVAELMVQEAMSFSNACQALGVKFDNTAAERAAQYCEPFRNILDGLEFRYFARTGDNPLLTKGWLVGRLKWAIDRLAELDQPDKIAGPGKLIADIEGWYPEEGAESVLVMANLTQADIDAMKAKVAELEKAPEPAEKDKPN